MSNAALSPWLMQTPNSQAKARVFCLPYSGCGASLYAQWPVNHLGVEFCPVQFPGRERRIRERGFSSYEALCDAMTIGLKDYFDIPFAFFGHCSSALIAYEATKQLNETQEAAPSTVFISAQVAPHDGPYGPFLTASKEQLRQVVHDRFVNTGSIVIPDLIEFQLDILIKDIELNKAYGGKKSLIKAPIECISWHEDKGLTKAQMVGWKTYGQVNEVDFPGDHYEFLNAPSTFLNYLCETMSSKISYNVA